MAKLLLEMSDDVADKIEVMRQRIEAPDIMTVFRTALATYEMLLDLSDEEAIVLAQYKTGEQRRVLFRPESGV